MKITMIVSVCVCLLGLIGCDKATPINPALTFQDGKYGYIGKLCFFTNENHRLAIAMNNHGSVAICEITDASIIKTKQFAEQPIVLTNTPTPTSLMLAFRNIWAEGFKSGAVEGIKKSFEMASKAVRNGEAISGDASSLLVDHMNKFSETNNPYR